MADLSPRASGKRERDYRDRRSPPRTDRRSPPRYTRFDRSPPRKRRRDDFDRRDDFSRRRDPSPDRRRGDERGKTGKDMDESPRRKKSSGPKFDGPLLSLKQFTESLDDRSSYSIIQRKYEEYKQEYDKRNLRSFFNSHKDEEWFRDSYCPSVIGDIMKSQKLRSQEASSKFLEELRAGLLDDISWDADIMEELLKEGAPEEVEEHKKEDMLTVADGDVPMHDAHTSDDIDSGNTDDKKEILKQTEKPSSSDEILREKKNFSCMQDLFKSPTGQYTLLIESIPATVTRQEIVDAFVNTITASKAVNLILGPPNPTKNFVRQAWAGFSSEEALEEALIKMKAITLRDYTFSVCRFELPRQLRVVANVTSSPSRLHQDLEMARKLVRAFDDNKGIDKNILLERISNTSANTTEELVALEDKLLKLSEKAQLDLLVAYLHRVHHHWYYTCDTFPSYETSILYSPPVVRPTSKYPPNISQDDSAWEREIDRKNKEKLAQLQQSLKAITGEILFEATLEDFFNEKVVKEADERYRCELCMKAFKAPLFVQKHIQNRHPETINEIREKVMEDQYYKNYCTDPAHITPSMIYTYPEDKPRKKSPERERTTNDKHHREEKGGPQQNRERSPQSRDSRRSPVVANRGGQARSPRERSPPRERRPSPKSPRDRKSPPRERSPLRDRRSPARDRSPGRTRGSSPTRDRSPRRTSPRDRSPVRERSHSRERGGRQRWSPPRRGRGRRGGRLSGSGGRGRKEDVNFDEPPPEFKEKFDPRGFVEYKDLDKPPEENVEIDYEKALAAFASGGL